jgi:hypothetical protein
MRYKVTFEAQSIEVDAEDEAEADFNARAELETIDIQECQ